MSESGVVRLARPADAEEVISLLETQHEEAGVFPFDKELVSDTVNRLTRDTKFGIVGVIDGPKSVVATVGLTLAPGAWYTRERTLCELWSFVHPDHRRSTHAKNLIAFSKECVDRTTQAGYPLAYFSMVKVGQGTQRKQDLYGRQAAQIGTVSLYLYTPQKVESVV